MIYDNCIKYIYDEMDEISKKEDLKNESDKRNN